MPGPSLPFSLPSSLVSGDAPVVTIDDVRAALPSFMRKDDPPPVISALMDALFVILTTFQQRAAYAAQQSDPLWATDSYLREIGNERKVYPQPSDTNDTYRARILTTPDVVTPQAILAAADSILAPYTSILSKYYEGIGDRMFLRKTLDVSPSITPRAFMYDKLSTPLSPSYPDRRYQSQAAANSGYAIPRREVGNARMFSGATGRFFGLRVPDITPLDAGGTFVSAGDDQAGWFVGDGTSFLNTSFIRESGVLSLQVYTNICNVVQRIKGQSVRWRMDVDPKLT